MPASAARRADDRCRRCRTGCRRSRRRRGWHSARYCGPQSFWPSAARSERRWPSRSALLPCRRWRSPSTRSRLARICWIWLLSGPHCGGWPLNSEKKPRPSQPMRRACASGGRARPAGGGGVLVALDLVGARRIDVAAVERGELAFEPHADRVALRGGAGIGRLRLRRIGAAASTRTARAACAQAQPAQQSSRSLSQS